MAIFKKFLLQAKNFIIDFILILFFGFKKNIKSKFTILTGSDSTHFNSLVNLLKTLEIYESESEIKIIDLGMSKEEINFIENNFNFKISSFNFDNYPEFVNKRDEFEKLGSYAWKPISIYNEYSLYDKDVIWLDAGCLISKNLKLIKSIILKNGFYSPESSDDIQKWTHPKTLQALNVDSQLLKKRNFSGGIVGFAKKNYKSKALLRNWYENSLKHKIISPVGSSRLNHRQDQAILSVLVHQHNFSKLTPRGHRIFGILRHKDNEVQQYLQ